MTDIRAYVDGDLVDTVKVVFPETGGLTATGVIDWALRKLLSEANK